MTNEELLKCLDGMALALADHGHTWTAEERSRYEHCATSLSAPALARPAPCHAKRLDDIQKSLDAIVKLMQQTLHVRVVEA